MSKGLAIPIIVLLAGLSLTGLSWYFAANAADARFASEFEAEGAQIQSAIEDRFAANTQVLLGGIGLWNVDPHVSREDWATYVASLQLSDHYPGIQGVGYSLFISADELAAHEALIRNQSAPGPLLRPDLFHNYTVHNVAGDAFEASVYTSIIYLEPFDQRNQNAMGLDMYSHPERKKAMDASIDTGAPTLSGLVYLVQEDVDGAGNAVRQPGFLLYVPHYAPGMPTDTLQERWDAILGFVYSPLRAGDLMEKIVPVQDSPVGFSLYDTREISNDTLLFASDTESSGFTLDRELTIAGREWTLVVHNRPEFVPDYNASSSIMAGGSIVSVLLFGLAFMQSRTERRAVTIATEMTAQLREREHDVELLNRTLERSNEDLERFAYVASHDLQEPVRTVGSFLELVRRKESENLSDQGKEFLRLAKEGNLRMGRLIQDLLEYSRVSAPLGDAHCSGNEAMAEVMENLQSAISEAGADIQIGDMPEIAMQKSEFVRVMTNLLSNAIRYRGEAPLKVEVRHAEGKILVADNGSGMDPDRKDEAFQMFRRLHTDAQGSGMGLAICRRIMHAYGGDITVETQLGHGSTFTLQLP